MVEARCSNCCILLVAGTWLIRTNKHEPTCIQYLPLFTCLVDSQPPFLSIFDDSQRTRFGDFCACRGAWCAMDGCHFLWDFGEHPERIWHWNLNQNCSIVAHQSGICSPFRRGRATFHPGMSFGVMIALVLIVECYTRACEHLGIPWLWESSRTFPGCLALFVFFGHPERYIYLTDLRKL